MKIENIREVVQSSRNILVWGPPLTGKTRALVTLVQWLKDNNKGKLYLYDFDDKCESLVLALDQLGLLDWLELYQYRSASDKLSLTDKPAKDMSIYLEYSSDINKLYDIVDPRTRQFQTGQNGPGAVVMDSLSAYETVIDEFVMGKLGHDLSDKGTDARKDYSGIMKKLEESLASLRNLPCISVVLAHEQYTKDDTIGKVMCLPKIVGKDTLAPSLARKFNIVLFSDVEKIGEKYNYIWYTKPEPSKFIRSAGMTSKLDYPAKIEQDYRKVL